MRPIVKFLLGSCASFALARNIPPIPTITDPPDPTEAYLRLRQEGATSQPNIISVAQVLLTALPPSIFEIAATNPATVPIILWDEFLDGSMPAWFANLPADIQTYLIQAYVGNTAPPASATPTWVSSLITSSLCPFYSQPTLPASPSSSDPAYSSTSDVATPSDPLPPNPYSSVASLSSDSSSYVATSSFEAPTSSIISETITAQPTTLEPSVTTATATVTTSADLPPPAAEPSELGTSGSQESGLSRKSKIGLGVGLPVGVLALAGLLALCLLKRRRDREFNEKEHDSDTAPFVAPAHLFEDSSGGSLSGGANPASGFQTTTVAGGAASSRPVLPPIDTDNPFQDPALELPNPPAFAGAVYTNSRSSPHRGRRRSGSSLRSIEEAANEDGDIGLAAGWSKRRNNSSTPKVSPILPPHDPMAPIFPTENIHESPNQQFAIFRPGSLKQNRRSSGALPQEVATYEESNGYSDNSASDSPHRKPVRRGSLTIGGGYRSLPSPHLQSQNSQSYILPRGEWLEDGEDLPLNGNPETQTRLN